MSEGALPSHSLQHPLIDRETDERKTYSDTRVPQEQSSQDQAVPTAVARGVRGAPEGEEAKGLTHEDVGRHKELDAQQMAMPGEGRVAEAVDEKPGATGSEESFTSDLERKKAEQAPAREAIKEEREKNVDVGGILGQRGAPVNPEWAK